MPAIDEEAMATRIPDEVRALLEQHRAREDERHRREREARRQARAAERELRRRNASSAERILEFARSLAASGLVPAHGIEIFRSHTGRFTNGVQVRRSGALCIWRGCYMGGGTWRGQDPHDFATVPEPLVRAIVSAIESDEVWDHVRADVQRRGARRSASE